MMTFTLFSTIAGWMGLLLAMPQHQRQLLKQKLQPVQQYSLRFTASCLLLVAALPLTQHYGASIGIIAWLMILTPASFAAMMLFSYSSKRIFLLILGLTFIASLIAVPFM